MRPSARASSFSFDACTVSNTCWKTSCGFAPSATSSAAARNARASVFEYWKRPVSVTRPT